MKTYSVGQAPSGLFLGNFNGGPGLATLNAGSNNGTLITGLSAGSPVTQTFATGGDSPTTGFAGDFLGNGFTDLVVGNTADGRLALLLGGPGGLNLAQTITSPAVPEPTGLSFAGVSDGTLSFYASTAGREAATALAFALEPPETVAPRPVRARAPSPCRDPSRALSRPSGRRTSGRLGAGVGDGGLVPAGGAAPGCQRGDTEPDRPAVDRLDRPGRVRRVCGRGGGRRPAGQRPAGDRPGLARSTGPQRPHRPAGRGGRRSGGRPRAGRRRRPGPHGSAGVGSDRDGPGTGLGAGPRRRAGAGRGLAERRQRLPRSSPPGPCGAAGRRPRGARLRIDRRPPSPPPEPRPGPLA